MNIIKSEFPCVAVQASPQIVTAIIPGPWLLKKTTPTWRIKDPELGFQRLFNFARSALLKCAPGAF